MNIFSPAEVMGNYADIGAKKTKMSAPKLLMLGVLAGFLIGMSAATTNTAAHAIVNVSVSRIICGLLFAFGLAIIMLLGAELFTGNCMILISVYERKATISSMLKNWMYVYFGNFIGALLLAISCARFGQLNYSDGGLAVYTIKVAASKCAMPTVNAIVMGIICNLLVCIGVLCSLSAKDTVGKILGAFMPVALFVICGFEHSVANMYYISAGLFVVRIPEYAIKCAESGVNAESLTWGNFFIRNLVPVTIGNIIGGIAIGSLLWICYLRKSPTMQSAA